MAMQGFPSMYPSFYEIFILLLITLPLTPSIEESWRKPGCYPVGHRRTVSIRDCLDVVVVTNGCRGYCQSYSIPSAVETVLMNPDKAITSMGQCCNIIDSKNVSFRVSCLEGERQITFKSATLCSCYHCKKE